MITLSLETMRTWIIRTLVTALAALAFGCGGSGSSGFDIIESAVIQRVVTEQECGEVGGGLLICPADTSPGSANTPPPTEEPPATPTATPTTEGIDATPAPTEDETPPGPADTPTPDPFTTPNPTVTETEATPVPSIPTQAPATSTPTNTLPPTSSPTPTTSPEMQVLTNRASFEDFQLVCDNSGCALQFGFNAIGFPPESAFRVAVRQDSVDTTWLILEPQPLPLSAGLAAFSTEIPVEIGLSSLPGVDTVQVIILSFESDPGPVPDRVQRLSDTGANLAFAVDPIPLVL